MNIKKIIKAFIPYGIVSVREKKIQRKRMLAKALSEQKSVQKRQEIRNYFLSLSDVNAPEILEIIEYFKKYKFSVFPYEFSRMYHPDDIDVFYDESTVTNYVLHENKRLYFPEKWEAEKIRNYYNGLCIEQDKDSPHHYETDVFTVKEGDIIADIGTAEGIWALSNVEKASKIYLFECEQKWIKSLKKTFEPWKEKVVIVNKFVSNIDDDKNVTIDSFFKEQRIDFIKADIEGMETKLLEGCKNTLSGNANLKLLLCTYHSKNDATEIEQFLKKNAFETEYSKGYMLFIHDKKLELPYIRRGLIRAKKYNI